MAVNLSIKNVPDDVAQRLRERAKANHRSLQGEMLSILEEAAGPKKETITLQELHQRIQAVGLKTFGNTTQMVREDRDAR